MSEYVPAVRGPLRIKGNSDIKKKGKKKAKSEKILEGLIQTVEAAQRIEKEEQEQASKNQCELTKAELAFQKQQEKMKEEKIKKKASMTHKQRVEEFNKHLDSLTEHFDIPKVSWTK